MDTMLSKALREFTTGPLNQLIVNLGGQDGDQWEQQLKHFLRQEICWPDKAMEKLLAEKEELKRRINELSGEVTQVEEPKPTPSILELVSTVVVEATGEFSPCLEFRVNIKPNAPVKISYLGDNFAKWFLSDVARTETSDSIKGSEKTLRYHKLRQSSIDGPIITELGGEAKAETALSEMFSLMKKQKNGEGGVLLNNHYANIFYIKDQNGVLRAVDVSWIGGGWDVSADSIEDPYRWSDGFQVFSRNLSLKSSEPSTPAQA